MDASQALAAGLLGKAPPGASLPVGSAPPDPRRLDLATAPPPTDTRSAAALTPPPAASLGPASGAKGIDPLVGTTIDGRYVVDKRLGEGGMGVVYLARHRVIDRKVALKVLRAEFARDQEIVDRFLQEAKTASSIGNPHIVDIHDFGVLEDGSTYFAMEFLDGQPLMDVIVREKIPLDRLLSIGIQICDGLGAAHERGIVHRDLKPDNVYLLRRKDADFVKVLDFGIAKVEHAAGPKLTRAGAVFGTPHYMSPEQAAGTPIDHRADIYALGVILYEMATGQLPFDSDNAMTILSQHMYKAPMPLRSLVNGADRPAGLEAIVQKCLLKRPEHRYATMSELAEDLKRLSRGEAPKAISDLMARSSSTGIPADYFKAASSATGPILPATPAGAGKSRVPLLLGLTALATVAVAATAYLVSGQHAGTDHGVEPPPEPSAPAPAAATPTKDAPAARTPRRHVLQSAIAGAVLVDEGTERALPAEIAVAAGETREVEVRAPGHRARTIRLEGADDGVEKGLVVELEPDAASAGATSSAAGASPTPTQPKTPPPSTKPSASAPATAAAGATAPKPPPTSKPKEPPPDGPIKIF
jgi:serine/threonine-protein kinase